MQLLLVCQALKRHNCGAQSLAHGLDPACGEMSSSLLGSSWVWKFGGGIMVAILITASLLPNFQTDGEPCSLDDVAL